MIYFEDQAIHVSQATGSDSNEGYGYDEARKTINAAIDDLDGDHMTIIVWPGTYDITTSYIPVPIGANLIGTNRELCKITTATGTSEYSPIMTGAGCHIENLTINQTANAGFCVDLSYILEENRYRSEKVTIENCTIFGGDNGIHGASSENVTIKNCYVKGKRIGLTANSTWGWRIENCVIESDLNMTTLGIVNGALRYSSGMILNNCICNVTRTNTSSMTDSTAAIQIGGRFTSGLLNAAKRVSSFVANNCIADANITGRLDGPISGVSGNGGVGVFNNCSMNAHFDGIGSPPTIVGARAINSGASVVGVPEEDGSKICLNGCVIGGETHKSLTLDKAKINLSNGSYGDSSDWSGDIVYGLDKNGLDYIDTTEPTGRATNFREMVVQTFMRFFNKGYKDKNTIQTHKTGGDVNTTQSYDDNRKTITINTS
jgi:parallel beta-helix repeat protein